MPEQVPSRHACGVCGALVADGQWPTHIEFHTQIGRQWLACANCGVIVAADEYDAHAKFHAQLSEFMRLTSELAGILADELEKMKDD